MNENGPWDILARIRYWLGVRYDDASMPYSTTTLSGALTCVWCLSVWVGAAIAFAYWWNPNMTTLLSLPFAFSAGAVIVEAWVNGTR